MEGNKVLFPTAKSQYIFFSPSLPPSVFPSLSLLSRQDLAQASFELAILVPQPPKSRIIGMCPYPVSQCMFFLVDSRKKKKGSFMVFLLIHTKNNT
jgi:hypothetical protein